MNNKSLTKIGGSSNVPTTIGGLNIGDAGIVSTIFEGFTLNYGDDFWVKPTAWSGRNLSGKYAHSIPYYPVRIVNNGGLEREIYLDNSYRGARNKSPVDLNQDAGTVQGSVFSITAQATPASLVPFLPTSYPTVGDAQNKPLMISSAIKTWPNFILSGAGNFIVEGRIRLPSGIAGGFWPSLWCTSFNWPDQGEVDLMEAIKDASGNLSIRQSLHISTTDGAGDTETSINTTVGVPSSKFIQLAVKRNGNTLSFYDDIASAGNVVFRAAYTDARVGRIRGAFDIRMELAVNTVWDSGTFNIADYPKTVEFDWFRVWTPTGTPVNTPTNYLTEINTVVGGLWDWTIPSDIELFGMAVDTIEAYACWDNADAPGFATRVGKFSSTMTVNLAARTVTGTIPSTEAGKAGILFIGCFNGGGAARRAIKMWNIAPIPITSPLNSVVVYGSAINVAIAYADFHSGNLGAHTYNVTKTGGSWLTITGNGTGAISITGTSPNADEVVSLNISCTNAIGQTTTITRTITNQASVSFDPSAWASVVEWWDASDNTKVFSDSTATTQAVVDSTVAAALTGKKNGYILNNATAGTQPTYVTDANGLKSIKFTRASNQRLNNTTSTALFTNVTGSDNAYAIIGAFKRGTAGVSVTPVSFSRNVSTTIVDSIRHYFNGTNLAGIQRIANAAGVTASTASAVVAANQWYTVAWIFAGTTLTIRVDGVVVASSIALDAATMTIERMTLGSQYVNTTQTYDSTIAFDGSIGELIFTDSILDSDANIAQAEAYLMSKWHN